MVMSMDDKNRVDLDDADLNNDGVVDAEEQLILSEEEESLPWLEAEEDDEPAGLGIGQLIGWALLGLLAIGVLFSAIWWFNRDQPDPALAGDGSTIEAPDEPFKTRPDDAGGREVDGTGDTSFSVAEGETVNGRVGDASASNGSGSSSSSSSSANGRSSSSSSSSTSGSSSSGEASASEGVGVQIGAFSSRATAQSGWGQLSSQYSALKGRKYRILEGNADSGTIYRLQAVASDGSDADGLCRALQSAGGDCQVKR